MNTSVLKSDLHNLIDGLEDEKLLERFYQEIVTVITNSQTSIWDDLPEAQKNQILMSYEESKDENNLIDHEEVMEKYKKWL